MLVLGGYGVRNVGDEAILSGLMNELPDCRLRVVSRAPGETSDMHRVKALSTVVALQTVGIVLVVAMLVAQVIGPGSKLATARTLPQSTLGPILGVTETTEDELRAVLSACPATLEGTRNRALLLVLAERPAVRAACGRGGQDAETAIGDSSSTLQAT